MNGWRISVLWWVEQGELSDSLEHITTLTWWIGSITPDMDGVGRPWWSDRWMKQPSLTCMWNESVMFKSDLLLTKFLQVSFPIFPQSLLTSTSLFFVKLEEDNICLFYNLPFGWTHRFVLTSLAMVKLVLACHGQVCRYQFFNEFNDKNNSVLFNFRESEKVRKVNSNVPFFVM